MQASRVSSMITWKSFVSIQQAEDKEEILLKRPWTDEEENKTYFRLKDLDAHLKRNKFFEYKTYKIAQRLRDRVVKVCS